MAYGNLGYYSVLAWILRMYPVFLELIEKMENRDKVD